MRLITLILLFCTIPAMAADSYFGQSSAGANDGSNCANQVALSAVTWTAGNTYHLCGTVTSSIAPNASGTNGNPITIVFEPGAKISKTACGSTGCINLAAKGYIVVDGGTNGIIEATNSGTGLGNGSSIGIYAKSGLNHSEIKNLTINNMYIHNGASDNASGDYNAIWMDGTNNLIHNIVIKDAMCGIKIESGSSGNQYYNNTIHNINWGIFESGAHTVNSVTNEQIYGNEIYDFANWDTTADYFHHDGIFLSGSSAVTDLTNVLVYGNYLHGTSSSAVTCAASPGNGSCMTAYFYINTDSYVSVFNNLIVANPGDTGPNGGWMEFYTDANDSIYNNTIIGGTLSGNSNCLYMYGGTGFTVKNNVLSNCNNLLWAASSTFTSIDYNVYQTSTISWRIGSNWYSTLAAWRTAIGGDANAQATAGSLNLGGTYKPQSNSTLLIGTGTNLTSLAITALNSDATGNARPATGAWDIGAYNYLTGVNAGGSLFW